MYAIDEKDEHKKEIRARLQSHLESKSEVIIVFMK